MRFDRRRFLGASLGTVAAGVVLAGCDNDPKAAPAPSQKPRQKFYDKHQMGILPGSSTAGLAVAFDLLAPDRAALIETLQRMSAVIESATSKPAPEPTEAMRVPDDSGIVTGSGELLDSGTIAFGASLFDDRYGLAAAKPVGLVPMPDGLARDEIDPARSHGDVLILLQGPHRDLCLHALRQLVRDTAATARVRWSLETFVRPDTTSQPDRTTTRNLMGFKDGTANPDPDLPDLMDDVVWTQGSADGEPAWTTGGTYLAARTLRMLVELWDQQTLDHQQRVFGRTKVEGAPLDGSKETDVPVYPKDPGGAKVPLTAHIRLANPRDGVAKLMLRRSMSYARGIDANGLLDEGLFFISYQRQMAAFLEAQARLKGEPMEQFVITHGGGFYFVPPGPPKGGYVGQQLMEATD